MPSIKDRLHDETAQWITLNQIPGLGNATLCQLLAKFGSPEAIFNASQSQLREIVDDEIAQKINQGVDIAAISSTLDWLKKDRTHLVTLADNAYPKQLLEISNPPAVLYAIGNLHWLNHPSIAMVGSRSATPQGEKNAEDFAESLCNHGLCVVSGMALGIDGAAHRGALKANGATVAVVGTGLDIVYPARHRDLAHKIAERGLILSEFPLGTPSKAQNFPRRNRLISGLSLGCLVVEANIDSGSLITARLATEQGREVFAIPGSIHSPVTKGCHQLIKQGAKLVENTTDILEELKNVLSVVSPSGLMDNMGQTAAESNTVLACMGFDPINFEALLSMTGLTTEALSSMLLMLELESRVTTLAGGKFQRLV
ncbi:MAG TPA: DNA-processing protein DprA [Methylotenera sp.]|nr:DNA-processing protein DprA [Methylotenera sp.]HPV44841.1 DNA-processing protein DprA [Methylotenera sp.]